MRRVLVARLIVQLRDLAALAVLAGVAIWALQHATTRHEGELWGLDLASWVARLDASDTLVRDSAIVAVADIAERAWDDLAELGDPEARRSGQPWTRKDVLSAVAALTRRLADPDSLLREHAVTAILNVTERTSSSATTGSSARAGARQREPLRAVAREVAGELILTSRSAYAVLQVLAAIGAPNNLIPVLSEKVRHDRSPTVRALALVVVLRSPDATPMERNRVHDLVRLALHDESDAVRQVASDAMMGETDAEDTAMERTVRAGDASACRTRHETVGKARHGCDNRIGVQSLDADRRAR